MNEYLIKYSLLATFSILAFFGIYFLKLSLSSVVMEKSDAINLLGYLPKLFLTIQFWLGVGCYAISLFVFLFLLQNHEISKIFPLAIGVNLLLTTIGGYLLLGESINLFRAVGIGCILSGLFLISAHG